MAQRLKEIEHEIELYRREGLAAKLKEATDLTADEQRLIQMQKALASAPEYMIMLEDMREEEGFFTDYYHQYKITQGNREYKSGWVEVPESTYRKYENALRELLNTSSVVLDVGCGRHFPMGEFLLSCGAETHGIDPVADLQSPVSGAVIKRGTAERVPYDDATFDVVTCRAVLEHLEDPLAVFAEFNRILKPRGRAVFLVGAWQAAICFRKAAMPPSWEDGSGMKAGARSSRATG